MFFHHDPSHTDDQLDEIYEAALARWEAGSAGGGTLEMALEDAQLEVVAAPSASGAA